MLSLGDLILAGLLRFVWILLIQGPLCLLSVASYGLQFMTGGLQWIVFFNAQVHMVDGIIQPPSWNQIQIPWPFIGMLILAFAIGLVIFIVKICKLYATASFSNEPFKARLFKSIKMALSSVLISVAIPVVYFLLTIVLTFFIAAITKIFTGGTSNLADYIYRAGWMGDPELPPTIQPDYAPPTDVEILQYNFLVQIIATWMALFGVAIMSFMIVQKTVELVFLYFVGPVLACTMTNDDGKKMSIWKDMVLSKNCVIIANYLGYWLFIYLLQVCMNLINGLQPENFGGIDLFLLKGFILIAYIGGAALGTWQLGPLIAAFFGDSYSIRESMSGLGMVIGGKYSFGGLRKGSRWLAKKASENGSARSGGGRGNDNNEERGFKSDFKAAFAAGAAKNSGFLSSTFKGLKAGLGAVAQKGKFRKYKNEDKQKELVDKWKNEDSMTKKDKKQFNKFQRAASYGNKRTQNMLNQLNAFKEEKALHNEAQRQLRIEKIKKEMRE